VTVAILTGSWRPAYLALAILDLVIAGSWLRQRRHDGPASRSAEHAQANEPQSGPQWSRRRYGAVLAAGMSVFFLYTGLEVGAGQWEASFCRGHLNLSTGTTGLATLAVLGPALTTLAVLVVASELILARLAPAPTPVPRPADRPPR